MGSKTSRCGPSEMPHASGTALRYFTIEILAFAILLTWGHTHAAKSLLRDVEFSEHVLVIRVVNIDLDPVQTDDALLELLGELAVYSYVT